ncbi:CHAT domain-containing protein [Mastigocladopsis repens]|uniref:CHAT domain-containing protein n=1 Tax=Mastigocladopsis repens TaxID=221287 RepID=UPI00035F4982
MLKKILILSANPKDTNKLRLDEEVREIQAALKRANNREQFEIVTSWAIRVEDLRRALLDHQPTIVHFSGHGSGSNGLALENNSGQTQLVSTESLSKLFKSFQEHIECVLLNACYSEAQAEAIHQHIDYVIGMNRAIGDMAAIEFAVGFYDALLAGRSYSDCFELGCASIDLEGIPESQTPVLKARRRDYQTQPQTNLESVASAKSSARDDFRSDDYKVGQNRSVSIGGNVTGSAIQTGDRNVANIHFQPVSLPAPESVDIRAELNALHEALAKLESPDRRKIENAFADAQEEVNKPKPDKDEVGKALDRALDYAKKAEGFASVVEKLKPHLIKTTAWLGENWHKLLNIVGLGI